MGHKLLKKQMDYSQKFDSLKQNLDNDKDVCDTTTAESPINLNFKGIQSIEKIDSNDDVLLYNNDEASTKQDTVFTEPQFAARNKVVFDKKLFSSMDDLSTVAIEEIQEDAGISNKKIVLTATVSMTTAIMGAGWMTLPKAFGIYGLALGLIMITFFASQQLVALYIYTELIKKYKNTDTYADLVMAVLGKKSAIALQGFFVINLFFT